MTAKQRILALKLMDKAGEKQQFVSEIDLSIEMRSTKSVQQQRNVQKERNEK